MNLASLQVQLQRAQALHQAGRNAEAWMILAPLRPAIGNHGQALRLYALVAQSAAQANAAIDALRQIARLERDPPDIVGALADTLGRAGRHDEALPLWASLAARLPEVADVHLNHAVTAANAGEHEAAVAAADTGLRHFPGHPRLLAVKAMALKNAGRLPESLALFEQAVAADPDRALTRHNQAVALRAACRFDEACEAFAASERLGMRGAHFHANWAAAALEAGQVDRAAEEYRRALAEEPAFDEALKGLTRLEIEYRDPDRAFAHYRDWTALDPADPEPWIRWAGALAAHDRSAEAADVAARGLAIHPRNEALRIAQGFSAGMAGDAARALEALEESLRRSPDESSARVSLAQLALRAGRPERASELLEAAVRTSPDDQLAWALLSVAWRLLDDPRETWLCDYGRLVMVTDVPPPDGGLSPEDYAGVVAAALDPLHQSRAAPGDQSLRGGTQTSGALFARPEPAIQTFRDAVRLAAERAIAGLPDDPGHPFLRRKSPRLGFSGSWSVRLRGGGHHVAHMHSEGWMSSAYYARLPETGEAERRSHAGWIQFGSPPAKFGLELAPRRIVEPKPGRLVLFPSYLWHGTIPFERGDRLTAAFDYQPL